MLPPPPPECWDSRCAPPHPVYAVVGLKSAPLPPQDFVHARQAPYQMSCLPSLRHFFMHADFSSLPAQPEWAVVQPLRCSYTVICSEKSHRPASVSVMPGTLALFIRQTWWLAQCTVDTLLGDRASLGCLPQGHIQKSKEKQDLAMRCDMTLLI